MAAALTLHSNTSRSRAAILMKDKVAPEYKPWIGLSISELAEIGNKALCDSDSFPTAIKAFTTISGRYDGGAYNQEDIRDIVSAINNLGYIYTFHYLDYKKGIRYLNQGLDLAEANGVKCLIPVICLNLGAIYSFNQIQFNDASFPDKTLDIYTKGLETALELKDWDNYLKLLNNLLDMPVSISHKALPKSVFDGFRASTAETEKNPMYPFTLAHVQAYESFLKKDYGKTLRLYEEMETKTTGFQDEIRYQLMALSERIETYKQAEAEQSVALPENT